uniref:Putative secreted protein n=1 Tax=Anopheles triannulatus TaxID=58253 RepID=A0A2M4B730_9DIPT
MSSAACWPSAGLADPSLVVAVVAFAASVDSAVVHSGTVTDDGHQGPLLSSSWTGAVVDDRLVPRKGYSLWSFRSVWLLRWHLRTFHLWPVDGSRRIELHCYPR